MDPVYNTFSSDSCHVETGNRRGVFRTPEEVSLVFDQPFEGDDKKCSCDSVGGWKACGLRCTPVRLNKKKQTLQL